jgi:hypothetical protein
VPDTCDQLSIVGIEVLCRRPRHAGSVVKRACKTAGESEGFSRSNLIIQSPVDRTDEAAAEERRFALERTR